MITCVGPSTPELNDEAFREVAYICQGGFHDAQAKALPHLLHHVCQIRFLGSRLRPPRARQAMRGALIFDKLSFIILARNLNIQKGGTKAFLGESGKYSYHSCLNIYILKELMEPFKILMQAGF